MHVLKSVIFFCFYHRNLNNFPLPLTFVCCLHVVQFVLIFLSFMWLLKLYWMWHAFRAFVLKKEYSASTFLWILTVTQLAANFLFLFFILNSLFGLLIISFTFKIFILQSNYLLAKFYYLEITNIKNF